MSGGGDIPFEAELYFDYCEGNPILGTLSCYRAPDELSLRCYTRAMELINKYGVRGPLSTILSNPIDYGFSVYIEQELWTELEYYNYDPSRIYITTNGDYYPNMTSDGAIYY